MKRLSLAGMRFGSLVVISDAGNNHMDRSQWLCGCDCGNTKIVDGCKLKSGNTKSCGCLKIKVLMERNITHGMGGTPTHTSWRGMIGRCLNKNHISYSRYGGRGIVVCDRWMKFENFYLDMGDRPQNTSIDRVDNEGIYEPTNCQWATLVQQRRNQRTSKRNKTGVPGVFFRQKINRWDVAINKKYIGVFYDFFEACCARKSAENRRIGE